MQTSLRQPIRGQKEGGGAAADGAAAVDDAAAVAAARLTASKKPVLDGLGCGLPILLAGLCGGHGSHNTGTPSLNTVLGASPFGWSCRAAKWSVSRSVSRSAPGKCFAAAAALPSRDARLQQRSPCSGKSTVME